VKYPKTRKTMPPRNQLIPLYSFLEIIP